MKKMPLETVERLNTQRTKILMGEITNTIKIRLSRGRKIKDIFKGDMVNG